MPTSSAPAVSATTPLPTDKSRNTRTFKSKNCWNCGDEGHFSNNCPKKNPNNSKIRALLEQFDDIDAAYETASSGADLLRHLVESNADDVDDDECRTVLERFMNGHPVFVEHDE